MKLNHGPYLTLLKVKHILWPSAHGLHVFTKYFLSEIHETHIFVQVFFAALPDYFDGMRKYQSLKGADPLKLHRIAIYLYLTTPSIESGMLQKILAEYTFIIVRS